MKYRGDYIPQVVEAWHGLQIIAPPTPYVAAAGKKKLYYIDIRYDPKIAQHLKSQIEPAFVSRPDEYISIDESTATAEVKNSISGEIVFTFDPPYARVLFARGMNRHKPDLNLPEYGLAGDWVVTYDLIAIRTKS